MYHISYAARPTEPTEWHRQKSNYNERLQIYKPPALGNKSRRTSSIAPRMSVCMCMCFANVSRQIGHCSPRNNHPACSGWQPNTHTHKRWKRFCGRFFFAGIFRQHFHEAIIFAWDSHIDLHKWKSPASLSLPVDSVSLTRVFFWLRGRHLWSVACAEHSIAFTSFALNDERGR